MTEETFFDRPRNIVGYDAAHSVALVACADCGRRVRIAMSRAACNELALPANRRRPLTTILPHTTPAEREMFLSGLCDSCFRALFAERREAG